MNHRVMYTISAILFAIFVVQMWPYLKYYFASLDAEPRVVTARGELAGDEKATIEIFEHNKHSVVYITTLGQVMDPWTRNILQVPRGTGTGFIWDGNGHVVTNFHVIKDARGAQVRLNDQRTYSSSLVGASPSHDLAVLRINVVAGMPPPVNVGVSKDLKVGQKVFAIGNPFGLDYTLTTGVISALNRTLGTDNNDEIRDLIQTDAAINPGNSGGPLLDSAGRLIGVNTAIYSPSGAYAGIGFAVPVDTVNRVVPELIAYGKYQRPSLGVYVDDDISQSITKQLGVSGLLVLRVEPGSAAELAGMRGSSMRRDGTVIPGDIIQSIAGKAIQSVTDIHYALEKHQIGDQITINVLRNSETIKLSLVLDNPRT